jgi:outer membrane lipoprotein-sorting protein
MPYLRLFFVLVPLFGSYAADNSLQAVWTRVDAAASRFKGMKADINRLAHLEVIKEDTVEKGKMAVRRPNPKDLRMLILIDPPNEKKVLIAGNKVEIYYPKMNTVQEYELGKGGELKDQLLSLTFGSTSKELQSGYSVTLGPSETIGGQQTTRLDLIPKDKELLKHYPKIQLWISDENGVTVQQKLNEPAGDFNQATYTNIQLANLTEADLRLDIPKNAVREKPQKQK